MVVGCRATELSVEPARIGVQQPGYAADAGFVQRACELRCRGAVAAFVERVPAAIAKRRIAAATQIQVAVPDAASQSADSQHLRLQTRRGTEHLQQRNGRVELLQRSRCSRNIGVCGKQRRPGVDVDHQRSYAASGPAKRSPQPGIKASRGRGRRSSRRHRDDPGLGSCCRSRRRDDGSRRGRGVGGCRRAAAGQQGNTSKRGECLAKLRRPQSPAPRAVRRTPAPARLPRLRRSLQPLQS